MPRGTILIVVHWANFFRRADARAGVRSSGIPSEDLRAEYEALVTKQVVQLGIPRDCVSIDVGSASINGRDVYNVKLRIVRWNRSASLRLLVSLPLLEARTRKAVAASWLAEVSQFGGFWVHSSAALQGPEIEGDSQWAISELQLLENEGAIAADRLRRDVAQHRAARRP